MKPAATKTQILGSLYAGALGDAFASAAEGQVQVNASTYRSGWSLTDDTQLTSSTCLAILATRSVSPEHIARQLCEDFQQDRYVGLGACTLGALRALSTGAHWALAGIQGEKAAGNGAAMRIAPLAFLLDFDDWADKQCFRDVVRITHRNEEALAGARAFAAGIQCLVRCATPTRRDFFEDVISLTFDSRTRDNLRVLCQTPSLSYKTAATTMGTDGFVARSVPMALLAAWEGLEVGVEAMFDNIISAGGDTDTIASMAGQLWGTAQGVDALPSGMLEQLPERAHLGDVFSRFAVFAAADAMV